MRINTNTAAMNTYSQLTSANASKSSSLAKLSSGLRINKAGDDAAGLAISEKMKNQISGMTQASRNAQDGISLIQTAEGALSETHSILNRMRDLTVQAANDTNTDDDRQAIQSEIESLTEEIDRIANDTQFNTKGLLNDSTSVTVKEAVAGQVLELTDLGSTAGIAAIIDGEDGLTASTAVDGSEVQADKTTVLNHYNSLSSKADKDAFISTYNAAAKGSTPPQPMLSNVDTGSDAVTKNGASFTFQIGANNGENIGIVIGDMTAEGLGIEDIDVSTKADAVNGVVTGDNPLTTDVETKATNFDVAISTLDAAIKNVSEERANLGATQNRLDHTVSNLATTKENLSEANSRITDVDMAEEMMSFTKSNILSQASTAMLAQANQMPQGVLQLLQ